MPDDLKKKLAEARRLFAKKNDDAKEIAAALAAEKYEPAMPLILEMLDHADPSWRDAALSALAEWGGWTPELFDRVRKVLGSDKSETVRISAASLLGANINKWPDPGLKAALENDQSRRVRVIALESSLLLAGMTWPEVQVASAKVQAAKQEINLATFDATVAAWRKKKRH